MQGEIRTRVCQSSKEMEVGACPETEIGGVDGLGPFGTLYRVWDLGPASTISYELREESGAGTSESPAKYLTNHLLIPDRIRAMSIGLNRSQALAL